MNIDKLLEFLKKKENIEQRSEHCPSRHFVEDIGHGDKGEPRTRTWVQAERKNTGKDDQTGHKSDDSTRKHNNRRIRDDLFTIFRKIASVNQSHTHGHTNGKEGLSDSS